jgi:hypothetical protein
MAFVYSVNNTPASGAAAIVLLKDLMKTAGWAMRKSSNGTTVSAVNPNPDPVDAAYLANQDAWFIMRHPDATAREIAFQRGANNQSWRISYSRAGLFSGGGTATRIASDADEQLLFTGGGTNANPTYINLFQADGTYRWNIVGDNAGGRSILAFAFPTGAVASGTNLQTAILFDGLTSGTYPAEDSDPFVGGAGSTGGTGCLVRQGTSGATWSYIYGFLRAWLKWGLAGRTWSSPAAAFPNIGGYDSSANLLPNPHNNKDDLFEALYVSQNNGNGYKGKGSGIVLWRGTNRNLGDIIVVGSQAYVCADHVAIPWPNATALTI